MGASCVRIQRRNHGVQQAKNGGYALIRTGDPIIMRMVML